MAVAVCNFIRFKNRGGAYTGYAYQNFFVNEVKSYQSIAYNFVPFGLTSGAGKKGGDRTNNALAAPPGPITVNIFAEACDQGYLLEVKTVEVDPLTLSLQSLITSELWFVSAMESDVQRTVLQLSSPLDAVDGQVPRRYLSSALVGALPTSGNLTFG
jgi:hypothetical protein